MIRSRWAGPPCISSTSWSRTYAGKRNWTCLPYKNKFAQRTAIWQRQCKAEYVDTWPASFEDEKHRSHFFCLILPSLISFGVRGNKAFMPKILDEYRARASEMSMLTISTGVSWGFRVPIRGDRFLFTKEGQSRKRIRSQVWISSDCTSLMTDVSSGSRTYSIRRLIDGR